MMRYETISDILENLRYYCNEIVGYIWFEHLLYRQLLPFDCELDLCTELCSLDEDYAQACREARWHDALTRIETDKFAAKSVLHDLEPCIPKTEKGDRLYWDLVLQCARNRNEHYRQGESFLKLFDSSRSQMSEVLCGDDFGDFQSLEGPVEAWRGVVADSEDDAVKMIEKGFSWTICREKAKWFAERTVYRTGSPFLARANITKTDMIAYLPSSGEGEIMVWPNRVEGWAFELLHYRHDKRNNYPIRAPGLFL